MNDALSARELDVARSLAQDKTWEEVGEELGISVNTVRAHVDRIARKLGITQRKTRGIIRHHRSLLES